MISKVIKMSWYSKEGKYYYQYDVYYKNKEEWKKERHFRYAHFNNLPLTILDFVLNQANSVETVYPDFDKRKNRSVKIEIYNN